MGLLDILTDPFGSLLKSTNSGVQADQPVKLQESTMGLIGQRENQGNQSVDDIKGQLLNGSDQTGELKAAHDRIDEQNRALGGPDHSAFSEAIKNKANQAYDRDQNHLTRSANVVAPVQQFNRTATAAQDTSNRLNVLSQQVQMIHQQQRAYEENRNSMLSSILGGVGSIAGMQMGKGGGGGGGAEAGASAGPDMASAPSTSQSSYNSSFVGMPA